MRNKYPGYCVHCKEPVGVGLGYFQRHASGWIVRCIKCVALGKVAKGKPLSDAQKEAMEGHGLSACDPPASHGYRQ